jgi:hypothetical protein
MPRNHDEEPDWDNDGPFDLDSAIARLDLQDTLDDSDFDNGDQHDDTN